MGRFRQWVQTLIPISFWSHLPGRHRSGRHRTARHSRRHLGQWAESAAAAYLWCKGWTFLSKNLRTPFAEIDLLFEDGRGLVVVEVKYRSRVFGDPISSVQVDRLQRAAHWLNSRMRNENCRGVRVDLILLRRNRWSLKIQHLRNITLQFDDQRRSMFEKRLFP